MLPKTFHVKDMTGTDIDTLSKHRIGMDAIIKRFSNADPSCLTKDEKLEVYKKIRSHNFD